MGKKNEEKKEIAIPQEQNGEIEKVSELTKVINTFVLGQSLNSKLSKEQIDLCIQTALSFGLNPLKREIHFVPREKKEKNAQGYWQSTGKYDVNIIVGYEVYLKRAESTGRLDGWGVTLSGEGVNMKAVLTIHKKGWANPFIYEVYLSEAKQDRSPVWDKMPRFQLRKVAISQGFRLAFPEEIGGMPYIPEEIGLGQTDNEGKFIEEKKPEIMKIKKARTIIPEKAKIIKDLALLKGKDLTASLEYFKVSEVEELNETQAKSLMAKLNTFQDAIDIIDTENDIEVDPDEAEKGIEQMRLEKEN